MTGVLAAALPHVVQYLDAELRRAVRHDDPAADVRGDGPVAGPGAARGSRTSTAGSRRPPRSGPPGRPRCSPAPSACCRGVATVGAFLATLGADQPVDAADRAGRRRPHAARRGRAVAGHGHRRLRGWRGTAQRERVYAQLMVSLEAAKEVRLYGLEGLFAGRMIAEMRRVDAGHRSARPAGAGRAGAARRRWRGDRRRWPVLGGQRGQRRRAERRRRVGVRGRHRRRAGWRWPWPSVAGATPTTR